MDELLVGVVLVVPGGEEPVSARVEREQLREGHAERRRRRIGEDVLAPGAQLLGERGHGEQRRDQDGKTSRQEASEGPSLRASGSARTPIRCYVR